MNRNIVKLSELLTESSIPSKNPSPDRRIRVRLNVAGVEKRPLNNEKEGATAYYIRKAGQFIYGKQNFHKGAFGIVPSELDGFESSADIPCFDVHESCLPEWIFNYFKCGNRYLELQKLARGAGSKRIHPRQIMQMEIWLPTIEIQQRILAKVKLGEKIISECTAEIQTQRGLLKEYRQAVLMEAISGQLTADWREENPDAEPASVLRKRIAAEKAKLLREGKIKKQKPLPPIKKEEIPFEIPKSWEWCRLGEITFGFQYGTSQKSQKVGNCPVLRMGNIQNGKIEWSDLVFSNDTGDIEKLKLVRGDILFNRTNSPELVGKTGIFLGEQEAIFAGYLVRFHMAGCIVAKYINAIMNSSYREKWSCKVRSDSIQQSNISATKLSYFSIPLPPLSEQQEIVRQIESRFAQCDALEAEIGASEKTVQALSAAILQELLVQGEEHP